MAEIVMKVGTTGPDPAYQDGDPVCAFTDDRIKCVHAENICHPQFAIKNIDGLLISGSVCEDFYLNTAEYKNERVSRDEYKRTTLSDGTEKIITFPIWKIQFPGFQEKEIIVDGSAIKAFNDYMNLVVAIGYKASIVNHRIVIKDALDNDVIYTQSQDEKEATAVDLYIRNRIKHPKHHIFGTKGNEYWYGGNRTVDTARLSAIWMQIEAKTPKLESDHTRWPLTDIELRHFLVLPVDNFDADTAQDIVAPEMDNTDPDNPIIIKKRKNKIVFATLDRISADTLAKFRDKNIKMDQRQFPNWDRATIVEAK